LKETCDVIIVGGGASGMTAAITAAENGMKTFLLEKSERLGRKISASGNGRCNMMNSGPLIYYGDPGFAEHVIHQCGVNELTAFFRRYGLIVKEEKEGRIYPVTMQSVSVLNTLQNAMRINNVDVKFRTEITAIKKEESVFLCRTSEDNEITAKKLIICTGGAAQKKLGGNSEGYRFLQALGHHIEPVFPSLVPVVTETKCISGLSGIKVRCAVSLMDGMNLIHREDGEALFTDYGISGICVMQCSRFIRDSGLHFEIDLFSPVFHDQDDAMKEIWDRRKTFAHLSPVMLLEGILLPRLAFAVLKQAGIPLRGETAGSLSDTDLETIVKTACHYRVDIIGTKTLEDAQVTAGGICCDEFDPCTMESKLVRGLHAAGEILNVDGDCGGYNLMFAFASGMIAGGYRTTASFASEDIK